MRSTRLYGVRRVIWRIRRSVPRIARPASRILPASKPPRSPVFVVGCPRSGTTLLLDALRASGELASVQSEGHILWDEFHHPREHGWSSDAVAPGEIAGQGARVPLPRDPPVRARRSLRRQDAGELPPSRVPRGALPRRVVRLPPSPRRGQRELADGGLARSATVRQVPAAGAAHRPRRARRRALELRARPGLARPPRGLARGDLRAPVRRVQPGRSRRSRHERCCLGRPGLRGSRGVARGGASPRVRRARPLLRRCRTAVRARSCEPGARPPA